jgi:hypothetical protein
LLSAIVVCVLEAFMSDLEAVLANIESSLDAAHERLFALLRIRSIPELNPGDGGIEAEA